jgi:hypothetical protein
MKQKDKSQLFDLGFAWIGSEKILNKDRLWSLNDLGSLDFNIINVGPINNKLLVVFIGYRDSDRDSHMMYQRTVEIGITILQVQLETWN